MIANSLANRFRILSKLENWRWIRNHTVLLRQQEVNSAWQCISVCGSEKSSKKRIFGPEGFFFFFFFKFLLVYLHFKCILPSRFLLRKPPFPPASQSPLHLWSCSPTDPPTLLLHPEPFPTLRYQACLSSAGSSQPLRRFVTHFLLWLVLRRGD